MLTGTRANAQLKSLYKSVSRMYDPQLLWRATDFWREALIPDSNIRQDIKKCNKWEDGTRRLNKHARNYNIIHDAAEAQMIPANFFQDVRGWLWSVKEDGYCVILSRNDEGKWSMHLRSGLELKPPRAFLQGLDQSPRLPPVMVGELLTSFHGCSASDREDAGRRTLQRNEQFAIIHRVLAGARTSKSSRDDTAHEQAWIGLRVKVFAFPNNSMSMQTTYEASCALLRESLHLHPHIGMCQTGVLTSTQDAINIFKQVVQMGLEGIVIVDPEVKYGTKLALDRHDDDVGTFYKLKQKVVTPGVKFVNFGMSREVFKDGIIHREQEYITKIDEKQINFSDQQNRDSGYSRLKYMEYAPAMGSRFPCQNGYRHMHFAQADDMSVVVPLAERSAQDNVILRILGVEPMDLLFNPHPFGAKPAIHHKTEEHEPEEHEPEDYKPRIKRRMAGVWGSSRAAESGSSSNPYVIDDSACMTYLA